jgi:hypothetical protein
MTHNAPMKYPAFDANLDPTDETLEAISTWRIGDADGWLNFIQAAWNHHYGNVRTEDGTIRFATGGWSANESVISAMKEHSSYWPIYWQSSHRGGLEILELPAVRVQGPTQPK